MAKVVSLWFVHFTYCYYFLRPENVYLEILFKNREAKYYISAMVKVTVLVPDKVPAAGEAPNL